MRSDGTPMVLPISFVVLEEADVDRDDMWMLGDALMIAPKDRRAPSKLSYRWLG